MAEVIPPAQNLATQQHVTDVKAELKTDIAVVKAELKTDIADVKAELKTDIADVKAELKTDIAGVRTEIADLRYEMVDRMGSLESRFNSRLWLMFAPMWLGLYGAIGTMIWSVLRLS